MFCSDTLAGKHSRRVSSIILVTSANKAGQAGKRRFSHARCPSDRCEAPGLGSGFPDFPVPYPRQVSLVICDVQWAVAMRKECFTVTFSPRSIPRVSRMIFVRSANKAGQAGEYSFSRSLFPSVRVIVVRLLVLEVAFLTFPPSDS